MSAIYIIIFVIGILFGNFYAKAIYKIPNKINLLHKGAIEPGRLKIFILEVFSGTIFVLMANYLKLNNVNSIISFILTILYFSAIIIIAGIDKNKRKIEKSVLYFGLLVSCIYIMFICITDENSVYKYILYLITLIILLILDSEKQINEAEPSYLYEILMLIVVMLINTNEFVVVLSVAIIILAIGIGNIIKFIKAQLNKSRKEEKMPVLHKFGFLFGIANIILYIGSLYLIAL